MRIQFALVLIIAALMSTASCVNRNLGPLNPCLVASFANEVTSGIKSLDLLFVIDNSGSMLQEQNKIRDQISTLVNQLLTTTPLEDLHVGVITTEGVWDDAAPNKAPGDSPFGANCDLDASEVGIMKLTNSAGCNPGTFNFDENNYLAFTVGQNIPNFITEVQCIVQQGTSGCGIEQQLDAMYYALDKTEVGGDNEGFLRDDALLAVIMVSDEDDCSAPESWIFDGRAYLGGAEIPDLLGGAGTSDDNPYRNSYPVTGGGVIQFEQICAFVSQAFPGSVHSFPRFVDKLIASKNGDSNLVIFAGIVGAPNDASMPDLLDSPSAVLSYEKDCPGANCRTMSYEDSNDSSDSAVLIPACTQPDPPGVSPTTVSVPSRRIVQFIDTLDNTNAHTLLDTICASDYNNAVTEIADLIGSVVGTQCLPRSIPKNTQDLVNCRVVEVLPLNVTCDSLAANGRTLLSTQGDGRQVCVIEQLPASGSVPPGSGWYYDDFSAEAMSCPDGDQQVAFTAGDEASDGAEVRFECFQTFAPDGITSPSDRGTQCTSDASCLYMGESAQEQSDRLEELYNEPGLSLICDDELSLTCQFDCDTDADCPGGFVCYDRDDPNAESGNEFCIIPTCTIGLIDE